MGQEGLQLASMGLEDLQLASMGLEDLQLATYGAGGPPKGLEDLKSGSRSQEVLQQAGGPPMGLEDPKSGSMGQEDLQRVWRTSNEQEDLQWIWRTPSQVLWGRRTSNGAGGPPMDLEDPKPGSMGQKVLQHPSNNPSVSLSPPIQSAG